MYRNVNMATNKPIYCIGNGEKNIAFKKRKLSIKQSKFIIDRDAKSVKIVKIMFPSDAAVKSSEEDTFSNAIWPILAIAQIFGIMPVIHIRSLNQSLVTFRWKTIRTLITITYLILSAIITILYTKRILRIGVSAKNAVGCVFFICCFSCTLLFLFMAKKWNKVIVIWYKHEAIFLKSPYINTNSNAWLLSTKIRLTAGLFLFLALLEHLMYFISTVHNYLIKIQECKWNIEDQWKFFFITEHRHVFQVIPYHVAWSLLLLWSNFSFTFGWNYMDIFIMLISIGLSTRFKQLNQRLASYQGTIISESTWNELRSHYIQLCELLEMVNANLAPIILLSCANNLYFICFQLLNIFNKLPYAVNYVYFWYSLLYLIGRTICVFLCAASINDESRRPIEFIRHIRSSGWCVELERFSEQVSNEIIALSGMNFFFLTRKLLFGMAGTVVTYELVLLQIYEGTKNTGVTPLCEQTD